MITSRQNGTVRWLRTLCNDARIRRERGEFLGAGSKLLEDFQASGGKVREVYTELELSPELMSYVTGMKSPPDCVFVGEIGRERPARLERCLLLEDMQDPGNVGAMLRCASAFAFDAVVLVGKCADAWQLKSLRGSMGAAFRIPTLTCGDASELIGSLPILAAVAHGGIDASAFEFPRRFALAIGNEGHGLSETTLAHSIARIQIPIAASTESLNAAAAAAILMYLGGMHRDSSQGRNI
jgi:TrmH family RNA methyltransferase